MGDIVDIKSGKSIKSPNFKDIGGKYLVPEVTEWLIGLDMEGHIFIIDVPELDPIFFNNGFFAPNLGLPVVIENFPAGAYKARCQFREEGDFYFFDVIWIKSLTITEIDYEEDEE